MARSCASNGFFSLIRSAALCAALAILTTVSALAAGLGSFPRDTPIQERLAFEHLSIEQGLSQVSIAAILQDREGFMWFATQDGLNRYDGYEFRIYRPEPGNPQSLSSSFVTAIYEDEEGTLWVGTQNGLNRMDRTDGSFTRYMHDPEDPHSIGGEYVTAISEGPEGKLWVGSHGFGLSRLDDADAGTFSRFRHEGERPESLASDNILQLFRGADGTLWICTEKGLDLYRSGAGGFEHVLSEYVISEIAEGSDGALWLGAVKQDVHGSGLLRYAPETGQTRTYQLGSNLQFPVTSISVSRGGAPHNPLGAEQPESAEKIWVGTYGSGLHLLDPATGNVTHYGHSADDPRSIGSNLVTSVVEGRFGKLWVGTALRGVSGADRHAGTFAHYQHELGNQNSLSDDVVYSIFEDSDSVLWVGTLGGGLNRVDRAAGTVERYHHEEGNPRSLRGNNVVEIMEDRQGRLWIGTLGGGLNRMDRESGTFVHYPLESAGMGGTVNVMRQGPDGTLWLGTHSGLIHYDPDTRETLATFRHEPNNPSSLASNQIYEITSAAGGRLWIGTSENGLDLFDPQSGEVVRHFSHDPEDPQSLGGDFVVSVHTARDGMLWVATYGGGLARLDPQKPDDGFTRYTEQNSGLPSNTLAGILEDERGMLWISTYGGLVQFNPESEIFRTFGPDRGVQSTEFNLTAYHRSPSGEMFFGGVNGLNAFFSDDVEINMRPPSVALTNATMRDSTIASGPASTLRLAHDENDISLGYVGLHYAAPARNEYAYLLDGYDAEWQDVGTRRQAIYTNLDPGNYTFRVKAANRDGVWSDETALLTFAISPPWWRTWWAYGAYALLVVLAVIAVDRAQRRRLVRRERTRLAQKENARKTQELEAARQLQVSMLPKATPTLPQVEIAAHMQTATEVGGDYYDFRRTADGALLFAIGDATGHGARAGTMVAVTKTLFNSVPDAADDHSGLAEMLDRATGIVSRLGMRQLYMALALGRLDGRRLELAGAGMPPALVYRTESRSIEEVPLKGMPLGGVAGYRYRQRAVDLGPGDVVVLMSDGFPEAFGAERMILGYDRAASVLREVAEESPDEIIAHFEETARKWTDGRPVNDDMTFVVLKMREE